MRSKTAPRQAAAPLCRTSAAHRAACASEPRSPGAADQPQTPAPTNAGARVSDPHLDANLLAAEEKLAAVNARIAQVTDDIPDDLFGELNECVDTLLWEPPQTLDGCRAKLRTLMSPDYGIPCGRRCDGGHEAAIGQVLDYLDGLAAAGFGAMH